MLLVLIVGITRLETVESFPSHDSFSSTSAVANISQEKNLKSFGFVERLHRRSINDCQKTIINSTVTRCCARINSVLKAGYNWWVAKVNSSQSIQMRNSQKTVWFVWRVPVNGGLVFMFGLKSTNQTGKYHFVKTVGKKLILSEPQCQPENNLPTIDERCFEVLSSENNLRHAKTGLFVTHKDIKVIKVVLTKDEKLAGQYRLKYQNEC